MTISAGAPRIAGLAERGSYSFEAYPEDLGKRRAVYRNPLSERVKQHVRRLYAADIRATDEAIGALLEGWVRDTEEPQREPRAEDLELLRSLGYVE